MRAKICHDQNEDLTENSKTILAVTFNKIPVRTKYFATRFNRYIRIIYWRHYANYIFNITVTMEPQCGVILTLMAANNFVSKCCGGFNHFIHVPTCSV